jgi:cytochrome c oxidase subunit II
VRVDALLFFLLSVSVLMALLIATLVIFFAVKYRRRKGQGRPPRIAGSLKLEIFWTSVPLIVGLIAFVWGADVYFYISRPPDDAMEIYVVAKQWMWKVQHPEGQREINELHVPVDRPVKLRLISEDVIHDFFVPAFRVKVDVLPARYVEAWFQATKTGRFRFFCSQYCGTNHSGMIGTVVVMKPDEYRAWLTSRAEGSLAMEGRKLFLKYQCVSCHSADSAARGPVLEGLYGRSVALQDGRTLVADENYLRESIVLPDVKIVAGFEPIMPAFPVVSSEADAQENKGVTEEDLISLIAYIRSLQPGQTPRRIEVAPPPTAEKPKPSQPPGPKPSVPK